MLKYTTSQKKTDMYDIGNGLTLMNIVTKNADGKPIQVDTYIERKEISLYGLGAQKNWMHRGRCSIMQTMFG